MSLLKNIDIWKGNTPRVCNFDLEDYCVSGLVGNNTTGLNGVQNTYFNPEGIRDTAIATTGDYLRAIDSFILSTMQHYVDQEDYDGNPFPGCITEAEWNGIWAFINGPEGPYYKCIDFNIQQALFFNSLMPTRLKRTDTITPYIILNIKPYEGPNSYENIYYTIDFSTSLYPTLQRYKDYTKSFRDFVQSVKRFMQALNKDTFPIYQP